MKKIRTGQMRALWELFLSACLPMLLCQACAGPAKPARIVCGSCEEQDRFVRLQELDVLSPRFPRPTHPFHLDPRDWKIILGSIRVRSVDQGLLFQWSKGPVEQAFAPEEVEYLSETLSRAFERARQNEWVVFLLSRPRSPEVTEVTSGGWFTDGSHLYFILANYRYPITMASTRGLLWQRPLVVQDTFYELVPHQHQRAEQGNGPSDFLARPHPAELSIAFKPLLSAASIPPPLIQSNPPIINNDIPTPPPLPLEERLQLLKRLHEQLLITDQDYLGKKKQLLDQF